MTNHYRLNLMYFSFVNDCTLHLLFLNTILYKRSTKSLVLFTLIILDFLRENWRGIWHKRVVFDASMATSYLIDHFT